MNPNNLPERVAKVMQAIVGLPTKKAVALIEDLQPAEIRLYLEESGLTANPLKLGEWVGKSLSCCGGEEHSGILAVLKPEEIGSIVGIDPEIFDQDLFISQDEFENPLNWGLITNAQAQAILDSGDRKMIARLKNHHPMSHTHEGRKEGPWSLYLTDVKIRPETVNAYFSAIFHSENSEDWKEESIRAIGLELLAFSAYFFPGIFDVCQEHFRDIADDIEVQQKQGLLHATATEKFKASIEEIKAGLSEKGIAIEDSDLDKMLKELRSLGIDNPTSEEVVTIIETQALETALVLGVPEN